jgi:hypothetical protein
MSFSVCKEELDARTAPLDLSGDEFRSLGRDLVDRIADFLVACPSDT